MNNPNEDLELLNDLGDMYSDMHKELYGRRRRLAFKTVEEAEVAVEEIWNEYAAYNRAREEQEKQDLEYIEMERRMEELMPGEYDIELPMQSGMGRTVRGRQMHMKESKLRALIALLLESHVDGQPYGGRIEDWAAIASNKWGHGSVVDQKGWEDACKLGGQFTKGKAPSLFDRRTNLKETIRLTVEKHVR